MRTTSILSACIAVVISTTACQETTTAPTTAPTAAPAASRGAFALQSATAGALPSDRLGLELPSSLRLTDQALPDAARRAISPGDYICESPTQIVDWFVGSINDIIDEDPATFNLLWNLAADLIPTFEALVFQTEDTPQYFGYNGEYTRAINRTDMDIGRFWDIAADEIQVIGVHGTVLLDVDRVAATYEAIFGLDPATAAFFAGLVRSAVLGSETLNGGNHPFFSFNALAASPGGGIPDKIVLGDGVLAGYEALGFGDVAPQAIFTHEFAHHVQFQKGYFNDELATTGDPPEQTRYTELMADAMAGYYLTHRRGATMNQKRVEQFLGVFFQVGDCFFDNAGHHGTPNQRMAATHFGFAVADQEQRQGQILTADEFHDLFVAAYPDLIAPDAD